MHLSEFHGRPIKTLISKMLVEHSQRGQFLFCGWWPTSLPHSRAAPHMHKLTPDLFSSLFPKLFPCYIYTHSPMGRGATIEVPHARAREQLGKPRPHALFIYQFKLQINK